MFPFAPAMYEIGTYQRFNVTGFNWRLQQPVRINTPSGKFR